MKRLLDLISRNIGVGQVAQHLFLRYWFFAFSSLTEGHRNKKKIDMYQAETILRIFSSSLFFVRTVDVVHTDVAGNTLPTLAFLRGIGLVVGRLWSGEGYLTGVDCDGR